MSNLLRILVIDDDQVSRRVLASLVKRSGHEAIEARDGQEGLAKALELRPDMIIAQRFLPAMSGVEVLRKIRALPDEYRPYVMLAAWPHEKKHLLEAAEAGIDEFIDRPLQPEVVAAQLRAGQRIARLQRENQRYAREIREYSEELTCSNLRLRELAVTDDLTGLPNRRYSMELMQHEWSDASREQSPLSCMVIDVNGLKRINDKQGLERGDVVLKTVAAILRKYLPSQDTVCRISGGEFLVICPAASLPAVIARGEKLVSLVGSFNIHAAGHPLGLSVGVAERRPGIEGPQELISLAEQAMHHAKRAGRNQVHPAPAGRKASKQYALWRQTETAPRMAAVAGA